MTLYKFGSVNLLTICEENHIIRIVILNYIWMMLTGTSEILVKELKKEIFVLKILYFILLKS
jgi:hypothetical protein